MHFLKGFLVGVALTTLVGMGLGACTKQIDPIVAQPAVQEVVATPVTPVAGPQKPTTQLEIMGAVNKVDKRVLKVDKPAVDKAVAEKSAYAKAKRNADRVTCLRAAVDYKFEYDSRDGKINDWGNILATKVCDPGSTVGVSYKPKTAKHAKAQAAPKAKSKLKSSATVPVAKPPAPESAVAVDKKVSDIEQLDMQPLIYDDPAPAMVPIDSDVVARPSDFLETPVDLVASPLDVDRPTN